MVYNKDIWFYSPLKAVEYADKYNKKIEFKATEKKFYIRNKH